ncbi:MAG: multidrug effflux MFS transporter [Chloroflexi bacterium]|nr:multidrug effflux MFS transporter [Chloroflexota bacterium]
MMMALTALSIDAMLPALPEIGSDLGVANPNDRQQIIVVILAGQAIGQLFFGPLSDKLGRKRAIFGGYALFLAGSLVSALSVNFPMMLLGRAMQGVGTAAPRAISMAIVRDRFEGQRMARVMSFTMAVFILVPMIAPSLGQVLLSIAGWRSIFGFFLAFALFTVLWFAMRIPETLAVERRKPMSIRRIGESVVEIVKIRPAIGFTLTAGMTYGILVSYLNSSQQIFQEQYGLGEAFPLYFAAISLSIGFAALVNARLVMRFGMTTLVTWALALIFGLATTFLVIAAASNGQPPLWSLMAFMMLAFFCIGILFGNLNTLAMSPLGHMAGVGAAVVGSMTTLVSMMLGAVIGGAYNGTVLPLVIGMVVLSGGASVVARWARAG